MILGIHWTLWCFGAVFALTICAAFGDFLFGRSYPGDHPPAPPPPKEWMERAMKAPVEKRRS